MSVLLSRFLSYFPSDPSAVVRPCEVAGLLRRNQNAARSRHVPNGESMPRGLIPLRRNSSEINRGTRVSVPPRTNCLVTPGYYRLQGSAAWLEIQRLILIYEAGIIWSSTMTRDDLWTDGRSVGCSNTLECIVDVCCDFERIRLERFRKNSVDPVFGAWFRMSSQTLLLRVGNARLPWLDFDVFTSSCLRCSDRRNLNSGNLTKKGM